MSEREIRLTVKTERTGLHPEMPWDGSVNIDGRIIFATRSWGVSELQAHENAVSLFLRLLEDES